MAIISIRVDGMQYVCLCVCALNGMSSIGFFNVHLSNVLNIADVFVGL